MKYKLDFTPLELILITKCMEIAANQHHNELANLGLTPLDMTGVLIKIEKYTDSLETADE